MVTIAMNRSFHKMEVIKPFVANIIVADPNSKGYNVCSCTRVPDIIPFNTNFKFNLEIQFFYS